MNVLSFLFIFYLISVKMYFISRFYLYFFLEMMHWRTMNDAKFYISFSLYLFYFKVLFVFFFRNDALENDEWCKMLYFIQFIFILFQVTIIFLWF